MPPPALDSSGAGERNAYMTQAEVETLMGESSADPGRTRIAAGVEGLCCAGNRSWAQDQHRALSSPSHAGGGGRLPAPV